MTIRRTTAARFAVLIIAAVACSKSPTSAPTTTAAPPPAGPFSLPAAPPSSVYQGPLFTLSHDYPAAASAQPTLSTLHHAIGNGPITPATAGAYVDALKDIVGPDMQQLLFNYPNWNAGTAGWYNQPWEASIREPIHGTFVGSTFPKGMFPASGLKGDMTTHVLVYYDKVAAQSLGRVWGTAATNPVPPITAGSEQFPEGSIIVKPAFTTADGSLWPPMSNAYTWPIYAKPGDGTSGTTKLYNVSLFQFDIIIKDTVAAPKTGWVFSTLVYDKDVSGSDWTKMVPLGAMWGNDPSVNSPEGCVPGAGGGDPHACPALSETWVNPQAPAYSKETLGWGGRLSGPNDGAVDIMAAVQNADGKGSTPYNGRYAMSSCQSCHGPAEYKTQSFLLPVSSTCKGDSCQPDVVNGRLVYFPAGSPSFSNWFQDRAGNVPQDSGSTALDYDMDYSFKAIPAWFKQTGQPGTLRFIEAFNNYFGLGTNITRKGLLVGPTSSTNP